MHMSSDNGVQTQLTLNPMLAFWALPFLMTQAWMSAWTGGTARSGDAPRSDAGGQIPVPPVFQEREDRELFA